MLSLDGEKYCVVLQKNETKTWRLGKDNALERSLKASVARMNGIVMYIDEFAQCEESSEKQCFVDCCVPFLLESGAIFVQKSCRGIFKVQKKGDAVEETDTVEIRRRVRSMECGGSRVVSKAEKEDSAKALFQPLGSQADDDKPKKTRFQSWVVS